jgi:hypothetical protein
MLAEQAQEDEVLVVLLLVAVVLVVVPVVDFHYKDVEATCPIPGISTIVSFIIQLVPLLDYNDEHR